MDFNKLSYDMKIEIISRTSLRTLDAIRCTNKELNNLSYDSCLLELYNQRNSIVSGLMIQDINRVKHFVPSRGSKSLDLGFLSSGTHILASSEHGILVLGYPQVAWYYVFKPATKQFCDLPVPKSYETKMVAIVVLCSEPLRYKIVRLSSPMKQSLNCCGIYCCEIFDSMIHAWRLLLEPVTLSRDVVLTDPPITALGLVYILLSSNEVLKIDSYMKKWTTFPLPNLWHCDQENIKLLKYEGKLGFACKPLNGFWEVWLLKADGSWDKTYVLDHKEKDTRRMLFKSLYDLDTTLDSNEGDNTDNGQLISHRANRKFVFRSDFEPIEASIYRWRPFMQR